MAVPRVGLNREIMIPGPSGERVFSPKPRGFSHRTYDAGKKSWFNFRDLNMHGVGRIRKIEHVITIGETIKITRYQMWRKTEIAYGAGTTCELVLGFQGNYDFIALSQDVSPLTLKIETTVTESGWRPFDDRNFGNAHKAAMVHKGTDFYGLIELIRPNYSQGTITLTARTFASVLLVAKVALNTKSADTVTSLVKKLVQEHGQGLKLVIDDFNNKVADILKSNLVTAGRLVPVWNLMESLAAAVHADIHVQGETIYFVKPPMDKGPSVTQLPPGAKPTQVFEFGVNVLDMEVEHSALFNHNVRVEVTSIDSKTHSLSKGKAKLSEIKVKALVAALDKNDPVLVNKALESFEKREAQAVSKKSKKGKKTRASKGRKRDPVHLRMAIAESDAPNHNAKRGVVSRPRVQRSETVRAEAKAPAAKRTEVYKFELPDATQEQCDQVAEQFMKDIASRELVVTLKVLGQPYFSPQQYVQVKGSGSDVKDKVIYAIKQFTTTSVPPEEGAEEGGYVTTFTLTNHPVQGSSPVL